MAVLVAISNVKMNKLTLERASCNYSNKDVPHAIDNRLKIVIHLEGLISWTMLVQICPFYTWDRTYEQP